MNCIDCGGPADCGWTDGEPHDRCASCAIGDIPILHRHRPPVVRHIGPCACCGRVGKIRAYGLRGACYLARWKRGMLEDWKLFYCVRG